MAARHPVLPTGPILLDTVAEANGPNKICIADVQVFASTNKMDGAKMDLTPAYHHWEYRDDTVLQTLEVCSTCVV